MVVIQFPKKHKNPPVEEGPREAYIQDVAEKTIRNFQDAASGLVLRITSLGYDYDGRQEANGLYHAVFKDGAVEFHGMDSSRSVSILRAVCELTEACLKRGEQNEKGIDNSGDVG